VMLLFCNVNSYYYFEMLSFLVTSYLVLRLKGGYHERTKGMGYHERYTKI
ncbi:hypothetical protein HKBW3S25_01414, partial [Candidatus Hakubella thermalkaliphila]